jgi:ApaG protein
MESTIKVSAQTRYIEKESDPGAQRYFFAYTIRIENAGDRAATLLNRHWFVTNAQGEVQEVQGPGVVGKQPHLKPGESFHYTSAAVLETPVGSMHGHYEFETDDGVRFQAPIPPFSLSMPNLVH